jgi:hypothetical protein
MICPKCGDECNRDEVHNGVCMLYGPWGCACGWSEDSRYDLSDGRNPDAPEGRLDQWGGLTPKPSYKPVYPLVPTEFDDLLGGAGTCGCADCTPREPV